MFIFGFGIGCAMQILVLIVQNSFSVREVGTVTAANNFFRQIGGSMGAALVGGLFVDRLRSLMQERLPQAMQSLGDQAGEVMERFGGAGSNVASFVSNLTPQTVNSLPDVLRFAIQDSYNDALTPIFLLLAPLAALCTILLLWITEDKLKETNS